MEKIIKKYWWVGLILVGIGIWYFTQGQTTPPQPSLTINSFSVSWVKSYAGITGLCDSSQFYFDGIYRGGQVMYSSSCSFNGKICYLTSVDKINGFENNIGSVLCDGTTRYSPYALDPSHLYGFRIRCDDVYKDVDLGQNCVAW